MGVLLYALLCGFLPFDDENISALYRKIQDGKYEKPIWLSAGSLCMLNKVRTIMPEEYNAGLFFEHRFGIFVYFRVPID